MTLNDVRQMVYNAANQPAAAAPQSFVFNPEFAIPKKWAELNAAGTPVGIPVTPEVGVDEGGTAQGFSSGIVLHWTGSTVEVV